MNSEMDTPELVPVGKVLKVHGVKGKIKVFPFGETVGCLGAGRTLFIQNTQKGWDPLEVEEIQQQPKFILIRFKGFLRREQAECLVGKELCITASQLLPLYEGEYYFYQLLGLIVKDLGGNLLGEVKEIISTGSNDVYVVDGPEGEILIPVLDDVIKKIDLDKKIIMVDLPEGLLD